MFQSNVAKRFGALVKKHPVILHRPLSLYCQTTIMRDQVTASTRYSLWPIYLLAELNSIDEGRIVLNLNFFPCDIFSLIHVSTVRRKNSSCNLRSYYLSRKYVIIFQKTPGNLNQNLTSKIPTNHQQSKQPKERFPIGRYWVLSSVKNSTWNKIILVFLKMTNLLSSH